jgi:hypothetical protein
VKQFTYFLLVLIGLWISPVLPSYALTAQQIDNEVRTYLKDQGINQTRQQFTDSTILSFINDGQREANAIAWLLRTYTPITLIAGTTEYVLPSDFMAPTRVILNTGTQIVKLDATSLSQLDANNNGWESANGLPINYWLNDTNNYNTIGFYPVPTTNSTGTVNVYYVQQPAELTSLTQVPFNNVVILYPYHSALIYYVVYRCYLALEEDDLAQPYYQEWLTWLGYMKTGVLKQPDFNPGASGRRQQ